MGLLFQLSEKPAKVRLQRMSSISTASRKSALKINLRKASEFREWKKRHKERGDSPAFRLALRHQLNWLVLTLEAAQVDDISVLSAKGVAVLESIIRDAEDLKGQDQLLRSDPLE